MFGVLAGILLWIFGRVEIEPWEEDVKLSDEREPDTKPPLGELSAAGQGYEAHRRGEPSHANPYMADHSVMGLIRREQWAQSYRDRKLQTNKGATKEQVTA
jgi:hypothetical protein